MKRAATGSLIGLALGDALGFPTEFNDVPAILATCGPWREMALPDPAYITDDTQMTLALSRGLRTATDRGLLGPKRLERPLREEFVDWYQSPENNRAPGNTCLKACYLLKTGKPWEEASQVHSKGCGANMRVAPVGLAPGLTDEQRAGAAQLQSALTHGHPTALAASDLTAHAVRLLAEGAEPTGLVGLLRSYAYENRETYHERWLGELWTRSGDASSRAFIARGWDECLGVLERLRDALRSPSPETDPCLATGEGWIAEEAFATGLLCFLMFVDEPLTALRRAACTSGDSDSIACLTGAFAGAHLGADAWPTEWTGRIEHGAELREFGALWDA
ncbi:MULTISPECIES: ADP-ribosylglycohydrolase family protein [unclassified Streptomyces]|uniref:ADP-ribosylglycohydrolase family protein n=1 Tax=unclassified Streptomyces TaxID=2593676 RepID=UPI00136B93B4|nr:MULTISPECIES: ADP-ribosylglycohydrolase family protein [unclassified Streptomyces]NEA01359.1 ADP-ribosylglycohydrolase family protein [Streptomyces sp. SID10116]MYY84123.1 ADP-ribosylglycohydrolase family protein [Streptomyces sp. SID335]MYZ13424.1 ADP-ribosylglycohydrolase family protein [Streptomyces sp. SID337]NDZ87373.1 ADP-ribosylglycohydrolase family protein [Streptomyces sp. SID10115]NEB46329.1 ADP-ribosylglycohydrolase family protein [Streptomyces sp. SID339]